MRATAPARPPLVALFEYTLRTGLPGRRWIGVLVPAGVAVLFGLVAQLGDDVERGFADMAGGALFALVLPISCLVVGDGILGAEIRSGTFAFTWMSPVPTWQIALARWGGGAAIAAAVTAVSFAACAAVAGASDSLGPLVLAGVAGAATYVAVFLAIGCLTRRAAAWSLAFVFLVERLLGAALSGIAQLSPSWLARDAFIGLTGANEDLLREGVPHGGAALLRLALISVAALALASWRLRHLRLAGSAD